MQRRTFIHLSAYTAIAISLPLINGCGSSLDSVLDQPFLFSHLVDGKSIIEAGIAYRKLYPAEDNQTTLKQLLIGNNAPTDKTSIQNLLDRRSEQDFKNGQIKVINGWVLSVTEARQCALNSILNS